MYFKIYLLFGCLILKAKFNASMAYDINLIFDTEIAIDSLF